MLDTLLDLAGPAPAGPSADQREAIKNMAIDDLVRAALASDPN